MGRVSTRAPRLTAGGVISGASFSTVVVSMWSESWSCCCPGARSLIIAASSGGVRLPVRQEDQFRVPGTCEWRPKAMHALQRRCLPTNSRYVLRIRWRKPPFHGVPRHRRADCLGNDESGTCRWGTCRIDVIHGWNQMHHEGTSSRTPSLAYRRGEVLPTAKARGGGQHLAYRLTSGRERGAALGPTGRKDSHARRGCACAAGSRGSSHADGCSAGRCACSRQALRFLLPDGGLPPGAGHN